MTTYNHMFTIAFSVETTHIGTEEDPVPTLELRIALVRRMVDLDAYSEWYEATGALDDIYMWWNYEQLL